MTIDRITYRESREYINSWQLRKWRMFELAGNATGDIHADGAELVKRADQLFKDAELPGESEISRETEYKTIGQQGYFGQKQY